MILQAKVVVLIVGFRNANDIGCCLRALSNAQQEPTFEVFIAENGGSGATDAIIGILSDDGSPCRRVEERELPIDSPVMLRREMFRLVQGTDLGARVHVAEMKDNLGYAGAVNAWLRPLLQIGGWEGAWVLNPDTEPTPSALAELVAYSKRRGKGMVGSCLLPSKDLPLLHNRGLAWEKFAARTLAVDFRAPIMPAPDPDNVDARLTSPSGASIFVTRELLGKIGLMNERYFLYFEDLDWGSRAKEAGGVGYAHLSVVPHKGGTTIGTSWTRATRSPLSVYLEIRNSILFVRDRHRTWLPWTILMQLFHTLTYGAVGAFRNMLYGFRGLFAGILGKSGRPDRVLEAHNRRSHVGEVRTILHAFHTQKPPMHDGFSQ